VVAQQAGSPPHPPILLSGIVPPLADPFYPRQETGPGLATGLRPGQIVVLAPGELIKGEQRVPAPAAQGGTGKTQLAVEFAHTLWGSKAVEVLVWVTATSRESVITGLAQAAASVGAGGLDDTAELAAARFTSWLAHTSQPWAVIIDDLVKTSDLDGLWPAGPAGQVVITTRLPGDTVADAVAKATAQSAGLVNDPVVLPIGGFSRREALGYLNTRLTDFPDQRIEALDLGEDLDCLPLAIAQAAAVMMVRQMDCREYRAQLSERRRYMDAREVDNPLGGAGGDMSAGVLSTWSIASECAHELPPAGLAWPALALAAMLDRHGIPGAVLTSPAACGYITGHPSAAGGADQNLVRRAISNLARVGLVTIDPATPVRTVRMHPSVQAAVRAFIPRAELEQVVLAAADALLETWTDGDSGLQLDQTMRDCAATLREVDSTILWKPEAHPLLFRIGMSFEGGRLVDSAIAYWQSMTSTSTRLLGPAHANAVQARDRLATAYESAGRVADAIAVFASALNDRERNLGPEHPDTVVARARLAHAYSSAGRAESIAIYERTLADSDRRLGPGHPSTLSARADLAAAYQAAGRNKDAIRSCQMLLADSERLLGVSHVSTLAAREALADAYLAANQHKDAIEQYKRLLAAHESIRGRDDPDAITARANLASALRRSGKVKDAIAQYERVLTDRERLQGPDHTDTIAARANLAFAYRTAGQLREAILAYEQTLADRERLQGPDHRDTRTARANLAGAYQQAGRVNDAIPHYERVLADSERMQGSGDMETLTDRCSLAAALFAAGRLMEVVTVLQRALADCERYLGPDHPMTRTVRENLQAAQ
jgi:tetratricopeptide (TPR) repeat protein